MKSLQPKTIDLYQSFFRRERLTRKQQSTYLKLGLPATALVIMGVISGLYYYNTWQLQKHYRPLEIYLTDSATNNVYNKALALQTTEAQLRSTYDNIVAANSALASYPKLTKGVFEVTYNSRPDNMSIAEITYDGATGLLVIAGNASKITDPADYVEKLKQAGLFDRVEYTGYDSSKDKEKDIGIVTELAAEYSFTVSCYLAAPVEVTP